MEEEGTYRKPARKLRSKKTIARKTEGFLSRLMLNLSHSWLYKVSCAWMCTYGSAEAQSTNSITAASDPNRSGQQYNEQEWENAWSEGKDTPEDWIYDNRVLSTVPDYVLEFAPLVHLFSGEQYWPCDIAEHLYHITPSLNYTPIRSQVDQPTLHNLDKLNQWNHGRWIYLTSNDDVEEHPDWLGGEKNIPVDPSDPDDQFEDNDGWVRKPAQGQPDDLERICQELQESFTSGAISIDECKEQLLSGSKWSSESMKHKFGKETNHNASRMMDGSQVRGGRSDAPAVLVVVDKGHGIVDAFWFFFYSFNLGNTVFRIRFGNHVGDWEHTAIRFHHGKPEAVYFSEHNFGSAYSYDAVEKIGKRPVIYSATGTHAMYATPGLHPYVLPWGVLHDETDRGPLWDPALNSHMFTYNVWNNTLRSTTMTPKAPMEWFFFNGRWGDKIYPLSDRRQYQFAGQYRYVSGPLGPRWKNLGRAKICGGPPTERCVIKNWLGSSDRIPRWQDIDEDYD